MRSKKLIQLACSLLAFGMLAQPLLQAAQVKVESDTSASLQLYNTSASASGGAGQPLGAVGFFGNDAASTRTMYSSIQGCQESATNGSLQLTTVQNGSPQTTVNVAPGQVNVTGNLQASGTISGNGSGLTDLNASNINSGILSLERLPDTLAGKTATHALSADTATTASSVISNVYSLTSSSLPTGGSLVVTHDYDPFPHKRRVSAFYKSMAITPKNWWRFNESSGIYAYDSLSGMTLTGVNSPSWGTGMYDNCLVFNGSNQYMEGASSSISTNAFSADFWIKRTSSTTTRYVITLRMAQAGSVLARLKDVNGVLTWDSLGTSANQTLTNGIISTDVWAHITLTYNGTTWHTYKDGVLIGTLDAGVYSTPLAHVLIGAYGGGSYWGGSIDNLMLFPYEIPADGISTSEQYDYQGNWANLSIGPNANQMSVQCTSETATTFKNNLPSTINAAAIVQF